MTWHLRGSLLLPVLLGTASMGQAQKMCELSHGVDTCKIELQNTPDSMEPVAEPTRIRVDNRSSVRLRLVNLSPLDLCALSGRSPAPTAETNPLESLVTSISALGAFSIGAGKASDYAAEIGKNVETLRSQREHKPGPQPFLDDPRYKQFLEAGTRFNKSALETVAAQKDSQVAFDTDLTTLSNYAWADYRGLKWTLFRPKDDVKLDSIRNDFGIPLESITDAAETQAILDEMTNWALDIHKSYDKDPSPDTIKGLREMDNALGKIRATESILSDNNGALKSAQASVRTAYIAIVKVYTDFERVVGQGIVMKSDDKRVLMQDFLLGTDRKATVTGVLSCVSDIDGKTPTTDQINYSILYQSVPVLSASIGVLTTFQEKKVIGLSMVTASNTAGFNTIFAVTDSARAQVFPLGYFNIRLAPYCKTHWFHRPEDELNVTTNFSAGLGVNPNTGTNQPEFFVGLGFGFNRLMIHPGVHLGRTESLGGGFSLNSTVPAGFAGPVPINWNYHPAFSIGFSVRTAPW